MKDIDFIFWEVGEGRGSREEGSSIFFCQREFPIPISKSLYYLQRYLFLWGKEPGKCLECNNIDTIEHYIYNCPALNQF